MAIKYCMTFDEILTKAVEKGASDVHLKSSSPAYIRVNGDLMVLDPNMEALSPVTLRDIALEIMSPHHKALFEKYREVDMSYALIGVGRFRLNIFQQRGTVRMVCRFLSAEIPKFDNLKLPEVLKKISCAERGLVLVTGITGSGKSTTLAAMIDYINRHQKKHIITIEDPIEYLLKDKKSIVTQRELGSDTSSFAQALRSSLRQDPDVIVIGEMRDLETIDIALTAAETGHLVFSTLHTRDASETISRILSAYPAEQQLQVRMQLAGSLKAIVSQRLAQTIDGQSRVPVVEVLLNTARISSLISNPERTKEIVKAMEEGSEHYGMQSFDQALMQLVSKKVISFEEGLSHSTNPENFTLRYKGVTSMDGKKWNNFDQNSVAGITTTSQLGPKLELDLEEKTRQKERFDDEQTKTVPRLRLKIK